MEVLPRQDMCQSLERVVIEWDDMSVRLDLPFQSFQVGFDYRSNMWPIEVLQNSYIATVSPLILSSSVSVAICGELRDDFTCPPQFIMSDADLFPSNTYHNISFEPERFAWLLILILGWGFPRLFSFSIFVVDPLFIANHYTMQNTFLLFCLLSG